MGKDTPCIVAQRMKEQRKSLGKTQKDIADKSGLSTKTINNLEHMTAPTLSVDTFIRLCDALECSADYLLGKDALPTHELSDVNALTDLTEDAIDSLMQRKVDAYKYGITFDTYDQMLLANLISYVITHFDDHLLTEYVDSYAWSDIGDGIIQDKKNQGYKVKAVDDPLMEIIKSQAFYEKSARCAKIDLGNKFMRDLEEWVKGISDEYAAMVLEKRDHNRK